jgi:hypothetical protein
MLSVLLVSWLQSYPVKGTRTNNLRWSPEGDRIPLRAIERIANKRFTAWAGNPVVIEAVQEANKRPAKSLDEIIRLDDRWVEGQVGQEWINELLNNQCANYLREVRVDSFGEKDLYCEIFVVDRQGCIVAMTRRTSDYWQGDEDKFVKAFADGKGSIFIDEADYDESTKSTLIQVSVPVLDPDTAETIGVLTVGLNMSVLAKEI